MEATTDSIEGKHADFRAISGGVPSGAAALAELEDATRELTTRLGADGFAICRTSRFADDTKNRESVLISSVDDAMRGDLIALGVVVQKRMERSLLPFTWTSAKGQGHPANPFLRRLSPSPINTSGAGFPVKLGVIGNGFLVFFSSRLDLSGDKIVETHREAYRLMLGILRLEVKKAVPRENLNDRELQCLQLAADGYKSDSIAKELQLSVHTVNAYLGFAADKLDAVNRIQAIAKAIRLGLIG